jgi:hypothetical protein
LRVAFDGGRLSSDGGLILLQELERRFGFVDRLASCVVDRRETGKVRQSVKDMLVQRVFGICLGYEDCNDFDTLREDPLFKIAAGRLPEGGEDLASQPTLSRLENSIGRKDLYRMGEAFVEAFIERHKGEQVTRIILDADGTEDPTFGQQEFAFTNGYHRRPCYVPLLVFATVETREPDKERQSGEAPDKERQSGEAPDKERQSGEAPDGVRTSQREQELLCALLRSGRTAPCTMAASALKRLLKRLSAAFPEAVLVFRGDSGFASPSVYTVLEAAGARYAVALARNSVLERKSEDLLHVAREAFFESGQRVLAFGEFRYEASRWDRERRTVAKAEVARKIEARRYIVTNQDLAPRELCAFYEERGDVENRIKEMKEDLASGRTSCHRFLANQFRLLLHAAALVLVQSVRRLLLGTEMGKMQANGLRCRLFKVAARVLQTTRRTVVQLPSSYPWQATWVRILGPPGTAGA